MATRRTFSVKIALIGKTITVKVKTGATIADIIAEAKIRVTGDIFVNGEKAKKSTKVHRGDMLGIVGQVDGGVG